MTSTGLGHYSSTPRARSQPRLLAFALDVEAETPAWAAPTRIPKPTVARMDPELAGEGALAYETYGCMICHGKYAAGLGGTAPDLRVKLPASLEYLQAVLDGALKSTGMPAYEVDERTAETLLAYQVNAAWDAYEMQQHGKSGVPE